MLIKNNFNEVGMGSHKEKFMSDTMVEILIGFAALVGLYAWKYDALSAGWRFLGMVSISLIVGVAVQLSMMAINKWREERLEKKRSIDMCRTLSVPEDSTDLEDVAKCWRYLIARYSPDLLSNRLSDAIGLLIVVVSTTISAGITIWYFGMIAYFSWYGYYGEPELLWLPLFFHIALSVCVSIICATCGLIFNRYPSEARGFNKKYDQIRKADALLSSKEFRDSLSE
ncbi:hypothetical protein GBL98_04550 [Yersinia pseudotuberculosis]|uniref:hypothetical protein n=1 Tax=Yersinia pseudotuberculosis TaxID=633 RepID=UPI000F502967|nr:hypothetical protein [Yersinia pseudotuberculosis]AYX15419.1 hypothetical protein EGX44_09580 [Yersinia pseudotuberculosis]MBO1561986.1 hypothetical protein [Yersinia pseudotuberculosis]MBO1608862.1 hypothetical protein [Yersinia pseudotuberculosis]MBO1612993.1 hypothetical protein [Yersinia pseudotuberculosis]MBO1620430.1 hypothetical protein [Yersinia pseudotuberculosis]